jgi:hypothetical protein
MPVSSLLLGLLGAPRSRRRPSQRSWCGDDLRAQLIARASGSDARCTATCLWRIWYQGVVRAAKATRRRCSLRPCDRHAPRAATIPNEGAISLV